MGDVTVMVPCVSPAVVCVTEATAVMVTPKQGSTGGGGGGGVVLVSDLEQAANNKTDRSTV